MSDSETHLLRGIVVQQRQRIGLAMQSIERQTRRPVRFESPCGRADRINARAMAVQLHAPPPHWRSTLLRPLSRPLFATLLRPYLREALASPQR